MPCQQCDADVLAFRVPGELREQLPDDRAAASICTRCLYVAPEDDAPDALPDFTRVSDALPQDAESAVVVAVALALLDSIALYREELDALVAAAECRGTDPFLVLDRLATDPELEPHFDLARRSRQLQQMV
jgi:hypothetical protein